MSASQVQNFIGKEAIGNYLKQFFKSKMFENSYSLVESIFISFDKHYLTVDLNSENNQAQYGTFVASMEEVKNDIRALILKEYSEAKFRFGNEIIKLSDLPEFEDVIQLSNAIHIRIGNSIISEGLNGLYFEDLNGETSFLHAVV